MESKKVIVCVTSRCDEYGNVTPLDIKWKDGRTFEISKVTGVCRAASLKAGGQGIRYTCRICGKEAYLYYDQPIWFMEAK